MTRQAPTATPAAQNLTGLVMRRAAWVGAAVMLASLLLGLVWMGQDMDEEADAAMALASRLAVVSSLAGLPDDAALAALRRLPRDTATGHLALQVLRADGAVLLDTGTAVPASAPMRWLLGLHVAVTGTREVQNVAWPLPRPEGPPWRLNLSASAESERAEALGSLIFMLCMLALCVAGLLLAMNWNVRRALAPLGTLLHAIARIEARDDRTVQALPPMPVRELEAVARALRHMADALRAAEDQRRTLGQRIITLQEDERARLGRELHDEFGQHLTALHVDAAWLNRHLQGGSTDHPAAQEVVAAITSHVRHIQQVLRSVLSRLRPLALSSGRLESSANDDEPFTLQRLQDLLQTLVDSWDRRPNASFRVELQLNPQDDPGHRLPAAQGLAVYRITQEALTNIARHAQARRARVQLQLLDDARLLWRVQDDGVGLPDPAQALLQGSGLGGIHERVWALGADLALTPAVTGARRPGLVLLAVFPAAQTAVQTAAVTAAQAAELMDAQTAAQRAARTEAQTAPQSAELTTAPTAPSQAARMEAA